MMTTTICPTCGGVKEVRGTSGGTSPLPEAMAVKKWCACAKVPDWQSFTFSPPDVIVQKDVEIANLRAELARLRAELEQAKADVERWSSSSGFFSDSLAMANESCAVLMTERDEAEQMAWSAAEAEEDARETIERQRRTIRALVVAARVARLAAVGFAFIAGVGPRRVHDEIRFGIKQADRQAGKE